jgi:tRNA-splicing ligase RtcB
MPTGLKIKPERVDEFRYRVPKGTVPGMRTDGILFSSEALMEGLSGDSSLEQLANVATLPGIVGDALAMPDIHFGYGFPVGGVAAFDLTEGVVSPGGIGYDINCGVRLIGTNLPATEVRGRLGVLMKSLYRHVPSGVGSHGKIKLDGAGIDAVLSGGAKWAVEKGYGWEKDTLSQEENGCLGDANPSAVSPHAHERGGKQLGTLGSGNHFLEVQEVSSIRVADQATALGLEEGNAVIMLHTGSRGLGHQVGTDYIARMDEALQRRGEKLIDRQLSSAPIGSVESTQYLGAMGAAANFAWANRQIITHWVRESFQEVFGREAEEMGMRVIYDLSHNMAKVEEHVVEGRRSKVLVHRKGATRAFPGQPVLIPGDMGTASYVLSGLETSLERSFGSACHGAGRMLSRTAASKRFQYTEVKATLLRKGIVVESASRDGVTEEAPGAYKNVDEVVKATEGGGLARAIARLVPLGVVKG